MDQFNVGNWRVTLGVRSEKAKRVYQVHGPVIIPAIDVVQNQTKADGIFVDTPNTRACIRFADCMPLVLASEDSALVLHISRKTLVAGILDQAPKYIDPKEITNVYIGPHICADHFSFEWEGEGITAFKQKFPQAAEIREGVTHLSLRKAVQQYFDQWNISAEAMTEDGRCTYETELPSHRRWLESGKLKPLQNFITNVWRD